VSVTIARWGNSFGIRIPKAVLEDADLREGDRVDIVSQNGQLVIVKAKKRTLEELVAKMTLENSHAETLTTRVGNEIW
jgi:antitoxin MazE